LSNIAHIFAKLEDLDAAINLLSKAMNHAMKIKDKDEKSETLRNIAMHFVALRMFNALEIAKKNKI